MQKPKFLGVYSRTLQSGHPSGAAANKVLYYAWESPSSDCLIQELDAAFLPKSDIVSIPVNIFKKSFRLESSILAMPVTVPDVGQSALPRRAATKGGTESGKAERAKKAAQLEYDIRSNFRKALSALARPRDRQGALAALEQLVRLKKGIVPEHKHMFRDFGVSLRKKNLFELALESSARVLEIAPNDDHAHFNIARIYCLLGAHKKAIAHLNRAIGIDGKVACYHRFLAYLHNEMGRQS